MLQKYSKNALTVRGKLCMSFCNFAPFPPSHSFFLYYKDLNLSLFIYYNSHISLHLKKITIYSILPEPCLAFLVKVVFYKCKVQLTQAFERQLLCLRYRIAWMQDDEESEARRCDEASKIYSSLRQIKSC